MIQSNSIDDDSNSHHDDEENAAVEDSTNNGAATTSSLTYEGPLFRGVVGEDDVEVDPVEQPSRAQHEHVDPVPTDDEGESIVEEDQEGGPQPRLTQQHLQQLEHQQQTHRKERRRR